MPEVPKVMVNSFPSQIQACNLLRRFSSCQVYFSWCPLSKQEATESIFIFLKGRVFVVYVFLFKFIFTFPFSLSFVT